MKTALAANLEAPKFNLGQLTGPTRIPDEKDELLELFRLINDIPDSLPTLAADSEAVADDYLKPLRERLLLGIPSNKLGYNRGYHDKEGTLTPYSSSLCLKDFIRTKRYLMALEYAVNEAVQRKEANEFVYIIDAGCGAIPIFAIYAALLNPMVRVVGLEKDVSSSEIARKIVESNELEDQIVVMNVDATRQKFDQVDILISETMFSAFAQEPFEAIMQNLAPCVTPNGRIIPEKIDFSYAVVHDTKWEDGRLCATASASWYIPKSDIEFVPLATWIPNKPLYNIEVPVKDHPNIYKDNSGSDKTGHCSLLLHTNITLLSTKDGSQITIEPNEAEITCTFVIRTGLDPSIKSYSYPVGDICRGAWNR